MKKLAGYVAILGLGMAILSAPAFSADATSSNPAEPALVNGREIQPSDNLPAMPQPELAPIQQQAPQQVTIPQLPPSLPCKAEWLSGLWQLEHVYETPIGKETETFNVNPLQYISFGKDSRFYRYNAPNQMTPQAVLKQMTDHSSALLQYLLQDAGMLYFYQDRVASETTVCFVVAETKPPYAAGNLMLMPPKGQVNGRLIKVYKKIWPPKRGGIRPPRPVRGGRPRQMGRLPNQPTPPVTGN